MSDLATTDTVTTQTIKDAGHPLNKQDVGPRVMNQVKRWELPKRGKKRKWGERIAAHQND